MLQAWFKILVGWLYTEQYLLSNQANATVLATRYCSMYHSFSFYFFSDKRGRYTAQYLSTTLVQQVQFDNFSKLESDLYLKDCSMYHSFSYYFFSDKRCWYIAQYLSTTVVQKVQFDMFSKLESDLYLKDCFLSE